MDPSWPRRIQEVQDHVRAHLRSDLSMEALARVAGASRFHFARLFRALTGETLVQFVQRARLERAATLMQTRPDRPLGEVALQAGFGSASDFSRVFRQHHGLAPRDWDRRTRLSAGLPDFDDRLSAARETCTRYPVRHVQLPAARLAVVRVATPFLDNAVLDEGYARLCRWFASRGIAWRTRALVGLSWDHPDTTPLDRVRFDLALPLPDGLSTHGEVAELALPAMHTVALRVRGSRACIAVAWERLYTDVLPHADAEPADLPALKRFRDQPWSTGWDTFDLDCQIA
ncbi:MAG: AraC family transcriptional regulator, partial [Planctomycetota bacterium]